MASDLISREALRDCVKSWYWNNDLQRAKDDPAVIDAMVDLAIRTINAAPAVDAEPVRHGFWNWNLGFPYCSECKKIAHKKGFAGYHTSSYCPNCGAKMDGGKE